MRRTTRKALCNVSFFFTALLFIIFINQPSTPGKTFPWTTIRYKTTSSVPPQSRGVCPGLAGSSKPALAVARVTADGDTKWLDLLSDLYHICVYTADAPSNTHSPYLQTPANRGHEAMAYLTFLIDNYADIPAAGAVFVHGSRFAWHNDSPKYDNLALLAALNVPAALAPMGYHNLRCDWSASMCLNSMAPQGSLENSMNAMLAPWDDRAVSDAALPRSLRTLFGDYGPAAALGRSDAVRSQCCAQFVVSQRNIWRHSHEEYVALRQWLLDADAAPYSDRVAGRILSYIWHILLIQQDDSNDQKVSGGGVNLDRLNAMACPSAEDCYCRLYGRCNLEGCTTPGRCYGQYVLPADFRLPNDWAATHS